MRLTSYCAAAAAFLCLGWGCSGSDDSAASSGIDSLSEEATGSVDTTATTAVDTTAGSTGGFTKLDVAPETTGVDDGQSGEGCAKVDFLFVVDNSESMFDEQQNLVASFPGFIDTIEETITADDFQIMVVSTDATYRAQNVMCGAAQCTCDFDPDCCFAVCSDPEITQDRCNDTTCDIFLPVDCADRLGAGKLVDPQAVDCGVQGGHRYIVDGQPNLSDTFECLAVVGDQGDNHERPMEAMLDAVGPLDQAAECNDGFVRDDAILVVTFISDEEDNGKSEGDPPDWRQGLIDAKGGNAEAVVVLGLIGDPDQPGAICPPYNPANGDHAEPAPRLREFVGSMGDRGFLGSICAPSYTDFFEAAVAVIDQACDEFEPEG